MKKISVILLTVFIAGSCFSRQQEYTNPILAGFYPDPSICRAENDYYLVNSSFAYFPGLPLFHSKDLVNWEQIGHALDRPEQLQLGGAGVSRGLFAPAISYNKGVFYIVCTLVDQLGNFVITASDPKGPWSKPVALPEVNGIDPSLFFDQNGKTYLLYNSIPPDDKPLYDGHRTIRMYEFDSQALQVKGEEKLLINGGTDITRKPVWIEGPHIYQKDGYYYLLCAEGGTAYNHSEVIFRSRQVEGPYESFAGNPILTQRHLDPARKNPITTTGHADFVEAKDGNWYAVFLGCRPYEDNYYNTGRETFMTPVIWKDGWPLINPGKEEVQYHYPAPAAVNKDAEKFSGNYHFKDIFDKDRLSFRYTFLRTPADDWYKLKNPGRLMLRLRPETVSGAGNPSFIGFRQPHLKGYATTSLDFKAGSNNEKAGLIVFQSEDYFYYLCGSVENGKPVVQLFKGAGKNTDKQPQLLASQLIDDNAGTLFLKIAANGPVYHFYYATKEGQWQPVKENVDAKFLSTKEAGGFVGCLYALYVTSNGRASSNTADFHRFECVSQDDIYIK